MARKASSADSKPRGKRAPPEKPAAEKPAQPIRAPRILAIEETDPAEVAESLGLEQFQEPDDAGLSLEELGQAYAALMTQGTDPYEAAAHVDEVAPTAETESPSAATATA